MACTESHQPTWRPPFCPNHNCLFHSELQPGWRFKRIGFFTRQAHPQRIPRFLCLHWRVSFSSQTFSPDYWLKRPDILPQLMAKTCGAIDQKRRRQEPEEQFGRPDPKAVQKGIRDLLAIVASFRMLLRHRCDRLRVPAWDLLGVHGRPVGPR